MKKIFYIIMSFLAVIGLVSCDNSSINNGGNQTPPEEVTEYYVTFNANGGKPVPVMQTVKAGERLVEPVDPVKEGYQFDGWFVGPEKTVKWDFNDVVTSNMTLHALWSIPTAEGKEITIAEALELCKTDGYISENQEYQITATVKKINNSTFGSMTIEDETGSISVYGTYDADGVKRYSELEDKPYAGDTVVLLCTLQNFNGNAEVKSGWILSFTHNEIEIDESQYTEMSIEAARACETGSKVKVTGVVARITYANGMNPNGLYLVDNTNSIYVFDSQIAQRVSIGNEITLLGEKDFWILDSEINNANKFGYKGCNQLTNCVLKHNDEKTDNVFDKSWISENTVKEMIDTPVTEDISTTIFKVNALVKKEPGHNFVNYYFYDIDGVTGSYTYTQCSGSYFEWLDEFDGKICTVYLSAINAKSTAAAAYWRFVPVDVVYENYEFDVTNAPEFAVKYYGVGQFSQNYMGDPELQLINTVSSELLGFTGATLTYSSSDTEKIYFETTDGVTVMHAKNSGKVTVTITGSYQDKTYEETVEIEIIPLPDVDFVTVSEAIAGTVGEEIYVKGVIAGGLVNKVGFYLVDETGIIAVTTDANTMSNLALGQMIIIKGTRTQFDTEAPSIGQTCILDATLVANLYGNHKYSTTSFISDKTLEELSKLSVAENHSSQGYIATVTITKVEEFFYSQVHIEQGDTKIRLYCSSASQYSWLNDYVGQTVTAEFALCNWNHKDYYTACLISIIDADGNKVCNPVNFQ